MTANPTLLSMPLAQNGQKNVIPETQATAGDGLFSQSTGFPAETSLPLGAGGVAPSREDFNGMANLLGGVAFMAQKGFTFNYDAAQDYYTGCVVIDPSDGKRYECIADMTAGTVAPHSDTANTYWTLYTSGLSAELIPAFNKRDIITTSGTYTAPVSGWYRITVKGGGGGGGGGFSSGGGYVGGGGGGEGGTTTEYQYMTTGDTATVTIGAGGTAGSGNTNGANGGNSIVVIGVSTYTGGGGGGGISGGGAGGGTGTTGATGGAGGTGTILGSAGGNGDTSGIQNSGGTGGGAGGGVAGRNSNGGNGTQGGGGGGGAWASYPAGGAGGDGYVWFEYFDTSLNP